MSDKDHYDIWNKSQQINNIMLDFIFYKTQQFFLYLFNFFMKIWHIIKKINRIKCWMNSR
jgi:hypothetical protein